MIRLPREDHNQSSSSKRPRLDNAGSSSECTERMRQYKDNLQYNPEWKKKWLWMEYSEEEGGMFCSVCKKYGRPPVQARGAWVERPINNWIKATELMNKHAISEWHKAAVEKEVFAETAEKHGDIIERMLKVSEEEKRRNLELVKKVVRSLYFLVKHRIPHTTTFSDLITLQVDNGDEQLKLHKDECARNASYMSKISTAEFLSSISHHIEQGLLSRLRKSQFLSIMADESTDTASKEEMSICARWIEGGKAEEHFLGILRARKVDAKSLARYLLDFLRDKSIDIKTLRGLGFDGASTMSGARSGVQLQVRLHAPSALYVHCRCHQLQLASVHAADEHREVKRMFGTLLTMWKTFHYSPKKAEKLTEIQIVLDAPELKVLKPSDTRWLARERCVRAVRKSLPSLVVTFQQIYNENGDAEAYGLARLLCTYKFVSCLYMLCDVLHTLAKLQGSLQAKNLNLASVPVMVESTTARLRELKDKPTTSTWFKDHATVFSDPEQLGDQNVLVTEAEKEVFMVKTYRPYIQSVIDDISKRLKSSDVYSCFSLFDPHLLPENEEDLSSYGMSKLQTLIEFYGKKQSVTFEGETNVSTPDIDGDEANAEWKFFRRVLYKEFKKLSMDEVFGNLLTNETIKAAFPNLVRLASLAITLPVTTASVERSFSDMKLIKTRLRNRLGEQSLDQTMRICIEGPDTLSDADLVEIITHWKEQKPRRLTI